ncbi:hypothetical protein MKX08_000574 [Trichoderma sp. CBMAI-0020]|nr:hypothetical protein MKX08_000574 [Trichoderma sp. CBMAI-0020]
MRSLSLFVLGLVGSPFVHADPDGGYHKTMFSASQTVATTTSAFDDSSFYSLWVSFMRQHMATVTVTTVVTVPAATTTSDELTQIVTVLPYPPPLTRLEVTETNSLYTTTTKSVSSCSSACPSMTAAPVLPTTTTSSAKMSSSAEPSKNGTAPTSTQREEPTLSPTTSRGRLGPSKTPPPLNGPVNGVSTTAAPVMGAVAVAIAGWALMV